MEFLPHPLIRIAGLPISRLHVATAKKLELRASLDKLRSDIAEEQRIIRNIVELLFIAIGEIQSTSERKQLIKLKKKLGQKNTPIGDLLKLLEKYLGKSMIKDYECALIQLELTKQIISNCYQDILIEERCALKELFKEVHLTNALVLSSHSLLENSERYQPKDTARNKKIAQLETGMLKYATRICTKTSPFSSLTSVGLHLELFTGNMSEELKGNFVGTLRSRVLFNAQVFRHITVCLKTIKKFRDHMFVRINSTISVIDDRFLYVINRNNTEIFQRLRSDDVTLYIHNLVQEKEIITYGALITTLSEGIDNTIDQIELFVLDLIFNGFLELSHGCIEVDPLCAEHMLQFIRQAIPSQTSVLEQIPILLNDLIICKNQFEVAPTSAERHTVILEAHTKYLQIIEGLLEHSFYIVRKHKPGTYTFNRHDVDGNLIVEFSFQELVCEDVFLEDTRRDVKTNLRHDKLAVIASEIESLMDLTSKFKMTNSERSRIKEFYLSKYSEKKSVGFIEFYEAYMKHIQIEETNSSSDQPVNLYGMDASVIGVDKKKHEELVLTELKKERWNDPREYRLTKNMLKCLSEVFEGATNVDPRSRSTFIQIYPSIMSPIGLNVVSTGVYLGLGKLYSRFLDILPSQVLTDIRCNAKKLRSAKEIFVENVDASIFNVNMHPLILDKEIKVPGCTNHSPSQDHLSISRLQVKLRSGDNQLEIYDPIEGCSVTMFDLGFQGGKNRSKLFRFLEAFSKSEGTSYSFLSYFNKYLVQYVGREKLSQPVMVLPRIIYEDILIIQRRTWIVRKACVQVSGESDLEHFISVNDWRKMLDMPDEIFIKIESRKTKQEADAPLVKQTDAYKPQYINFRSPMLVAYFVKLLFRAKDRIIIEEMLPNSEQLMNINEEATVTELLIQWSNG